MISLVSIFKFYILFLFFNNYFILSSKVLLKVLGAVPSPCIKFDIFNSWFIILTFMSFYTPNRIPIYIKVYNFISLGIFDLDYYFNILIPSFILNVSYARA